MYRVTSVSVFMCHIWLTTVHTPQHTGNSAILSNICKCIVAKRSDHLSILAYKWRKQCGKQSQSFWVDGFKHLVKHWSWEKMMGWCTARCKMLLFCAKIIVRGSHSIESAHLRKPILVTFWFATFSVMLFFCVTRSLVGHENTKNEWYMYIKAYKFKICEIVIYCMSMLSLHIETTNFMIVYMFISHAYKRAFSIQTHSSW